MNQSAERTKPAAGTDVRTLPGVGDGIAARLARLGITSLLDLALHLPAGYQDRTRVTPLGALTEGEYLTEGSVQEVRVQFGRRRSLLVRVADGHRSLQLRFFHFSAAQQQRFAAAGRVRVFGRVRQSGQGPEMVHPEYRLFDGTPPPTEDALTPIYPLCEGLTQARLRKLAGLALDRLAGEKLELMPTNALPDGAQMSLLAALRLAHAPPAGRGLESLEVARNRLKIEELTAHRLAMRRRRHYREGLRALPSRADVLRDRFLSALPFDPTAGQQQAIEAICADLALAHPMRRLLQGDVGCGKTVVAAAAACRVIEAGHQVAFMAPTELLAEQHARTLADWLTPLGVSIAYLGGRTAARQRRPVLEQLADGRLQLVVGTHALFQAGVEFAALALVIIDEQHRFGVAQRLALADKGPGGNAVPHQLIMTATPIPRTLSMSFYGDIDFTSIRELPPGRSPVQTIALSAGRRGEVIARIAAACADGRQAYWVCTLIEDSEHLQAQAAEEAAELLAAELPGLAVGLVHGRMKGPERAERMAAFRSGTLHVLVATTVIEVGVDVPNASLMIIENAERLGLSQLHQLRGRVGRGATESFCVLLYQPPLGQVARRRIDVLRATGDGFRIAEEDLALRGPGDPLGTRQAGELQFRIANPVDDAALLPVATRVADRLWAQDPEGVDALIRRWLPGQGRLHEA